MTLSFGGSEISKRKFFSGHAVQEEQLLVAGYWLLYLDRSLVPDADGIIFVRRVGKHSPNHIASHRCENLKSGTVVCISHTWRGSQTKRVTQRDANKIHFQYFIFRRRRVTNCGTESNICSRKYITNFWNYKKAALCASPRSSLYIVYKTGRIMVSFCPSVSMFNS